MAETKPQEYLPFSLEVRIKITDENKIINAMRNWHGSLSTNIMHDEKTSSTVVEYKFSEKSDTEWPTSSQHEVQKVVIELLAIHEILRRVGIVISAFIEVSRTSLPKDHAIFYTDPKTHRILIRNEYLPRIVEFNEKQHFPPGDAAQFDILEITLHSPLSAKAIVKAFRTVTLGVMLLLSPATPLGTSIPPLPSRHEHVLPRANDKGLPSQKKQPIQDDGDTRCDTQSPDEDEINLIVGTIGDVLAGIGVSFQCKVSNRDRRRLASKNASGIRRDINKKDFSSLQQFLYELGYYKTPPKKFTSKRNRQLDDAIKKFKKHHNIPEKTTLTSPLFLKKIGEESAENSIEL